jgi:hypothetical protein
MKIDWYTDCIVSLHSLQQGNLFVSIQTTRLRLETEWLPAPNWEFFRVGWTYSEGGLGTGNGFRSVN